MIKETPNPPEADDVSPYESPDSKKLNDAADRALNHYLNPSALKSPVARKPSTMFWSRRISKTKTCGPHL